jgi:hypothetical protein
VRFFFLRVLSVILCVLCGETVAESSRFLFNRKARRVPHAQAAVSAEGAEKFSFSSHLTPHASILPFAFFLCDLASLRAFSSSSSRLTPHASRLFYFASWRLCVLFFFSATMKLIVIPLKNNTSDLMILNF